MLTQKRKHLQYIGQLVWTNLSSVVGLKSNIFPQWNFSYSRLLLWDILELFVSARLHCPVQLLVFWRARSLSAQIQVRTLVNSWYVKLWLLDVNDLAPRENFPNVEHYEFSETNLHSMNQLNALAQVRSMVTLFYFCVSSTDVAFSFRCKVSPLWQSVRKETHFMPRTGDPTPSSGYFYS